MRILIINPNSSEDMTKDIQQAASAYADGKFDVVTVSTPGAPKFINTYEDTTKAAPGMIQLLQENMPHFDAFVIACHCDPNLDLMKELSPKPVVGIGEASMKLASMIGHRFSVISSDVYSIPNKQALIHRYFLDSCCASVRAPNGDSHLTEKERILDAAKLAMHDDMAEVIVLGCAGMAGLDRYISDRLGAPVLDGVICALMIASGMVQANISISKVRRYNGANATQF